MIRRAGPGASLCTELARDAGGAVLVEFALTIPTIFIMFFGMLQWMMNAQVHLLVKHAAVVAARAEAVIHPGMSDSGSQEDVQEAARLILKTRYHGPILVTTTLAPEESQELQSVTISIDYPCRVPLGNRIACRGGKQHLSETSSFPNQGAAYQAIWGSGAGGSQ